MRAPCACSISKDAMDNQNWSADFSQGYALVSHIEFLGTNSYSGTNAQYDLS